MTYQKAYENAREVFRANAEFGASDSEPEWHMEDEIRRYLHGKEYRELSADRWELYTASRKCDGAAKRLNSAMKKLHKAIAEVKVKEFKPMFKYFQGNLWRVELDWEPIA